VADFALQDIETSQEQPKRKQGWGEAGPGRPKGRANNLTLRQREVAEMVLGKPGTPEFDEFVQAERRSALSGLMAPGVKTLWMHYLLGVPKVSVDVEGSVTIEKIVREVIDVLPSQQEERREALH
jgi:hypothetical protein